MATTTGQHQLTAFTTPVNGTSPIDADEVRTNDATIRTAYNAHDSDTGIHVQSSVLGSRPAAGTSGRKWLTVDALSAPTSVRAFYDDGTNWYELSYLSTAGGTVAGNLSVTGTGAFGDSVTVTNSLTVTRADNEVDLYLTRTGTSALSVYFYNTGLGAGLYDGTNTRTVFNYNPAGGGSFDTNLLVNAGAGLAVTGNATVSGTVSVTGASLIVNNADAIIGITPTSGSYTGAGIQSIVTRAASTAFDHFYATANSVVGFRVRGDGSVYAAQALTVAAGGIAVTGNSTITGSLGGITGLTVASGGASIAGGGAVTGTWAVTGTLTATTGLTVSAGGAAITGNSTVAGTLAVTSTINSQTISATANFTGTVTVATGLTVSAGALVVTSSSGTQLAVRFDGSNQFNMLVDSAGGVTYTSSGTLPQHTFNQTVVLGSTVNIWDGAASRLVQFGANDSAGTGFRTVRVVNA